MGLIFAASLAGRYPNITPIQLGTKRPITTDVQEMLSAMVFRTKPVTAKRNASAVTTPTTAPVKLMKTAQQKLAPDLDRSGTQSLAKANLVGSF